MRMTTAFSTLLAASIASSMSVADLKRQMDQSTALGKPLLAVVGADWCPPCKVLDKQLHEDAKWKAAGAKFVYIHIDVDKDKEAWKTFSDKYGVEGNGIPRIYIIAPDGKKAFAQCGYTPKLLDTFTKFGNELASKGKRVLNSKELGKLRAANKAAAEMLKSGKFVSAYGSLKEYEEFFESDHALVKTARKTFNEVLHAAEERIESAGKVAMLNSDPDRFDGAYHLAVMSRTFADREDLKSKVDAKIDEVRKDERASDLMKQALLFDDGREAERAEETDKAKEIYNRLVTEFKGKPGARKAKERLDSMEG